MQALKSLGQILGWLNGRKMALGLLLTFLSATAVQLPPVLEAFGFDSLKVAYYVGMATTIIGALHKVIKGR